MDRVLTEVCVGGAQRAWIAALRRARRGACGWCHQIILGRDKMDYIRGLPHKLGAFERLLRDYPQWRDNVVLVQVTEPAAAASEDRATGTTAMAITPFAVSRTAVADQRRLELQVAELAAKINSAYGSLSFTPVQIIHVRAQAAHSLGEAEGTVPGEAEGMAARGAH